MCFLGTTIVYRCGKGDFMFEIKNELEYVFLLKFLFEKSYLQYAKEF